MTSSDVMNHSPVAGLKSPTAFQPSSRCHEDLTRQFSLESTLLLMVRYVFQGVFKLVDVKLLWNYRTVSTKHGVPGRGLILPQIE